jgi:hypothetical protein
MAEEKESKKMGRALVARGRTVEAAVPGSKRVVGYDPDTKQALHGPVMKQYGEHQEVTLPLDEIRTLQDSGFLIDPNKGQEPRNALAEGSHMQEFSN